MPLPGSASCRELGAVVLLCANDWLALHGSVLQHFSCVVSETHIVNYSFEDDRRYQRNLKSWGGGVVYSVGP